MADTKLPPIKAVYVEQFEGWWKLSIEEWRKLLKEGIETGGHMLPKHKLQMRPRFIFVDGRPGSSTCYYFTHREDILVRSPLDWEEENYRDALTELEELEREGRVPGEGGAKLKSVSKEGSCSGT